MIRKIILLCFCFLGLLAIQVASAKTNKNLLLATTSSVHNSGLLDIVLRDFEKRTGIIVKAVIQGSGLAIQSAINGNADVILTHAPDAEKDFVASGYGIKRYPFMYNQFVIVGPDEDKINIHGIKILPALQMIAKNRGSFVSRGDDSGTHQKELFLWQMAGIIPETKSGLFNWRNRWYIQSGTGMSQSLTIAYEKRAYILTDYGTWLRLQNRMKDFKVHVKDDELLNNQYSVIAVNPDKHPYIQYELAQKFIAFLIGKNGQKIIADYKINGEPLFFPNAQ